ncbi:Dedicator of cytokinesis protein 6, putative isoform 1 [Hibiscus syriacus]|uniref:Dedicator of cytokinesis protein 6, putative isoform 1 n=1 Tax=Hibiscus syriacus TaxID=106335 RepID=A0A6A3CQU8_HIBSY|nr:Dedicator of cytokinesis protein 6, putative isoform 1 [Hibiscus syriacus]
MMSSGHCCTKSTRRFRHNMGFSMLPLPDGGSDYRLGVTWRPVQRERNAAYLMTVTEDVMCGLADGLIAALQNYRRPQFFGPRKIWQPALGILIIYVVTTLSIFPGFIAEDLESKLLQDWYPVLLITVYNLADFVGISITAIYALQNIKKATRGCIARPFFYPLFTSSLHGPK